MSQTQATSGAPPVRASDTERDQAAEILRAGYAEGRLGRAELDERLAAAYVAKTRADLDDVDVAEVLIDGGADIEAPGGSIGTPLGNAVGYGRWHVARKLVERGALVDALWQAVALGMLSRAQELLAASPPPGQEEITEAFWQACHGGQRRVAEYLLRRGADMNGIPGYAQQTPLDIAPGPDTRRDLLVTWLREQGAVSRERPGD